MINIKGFLKLILKLFIVTLLIIAIIVSIIIYNGYRIYKDVITEIPLEIKIDNLKENTNYTINENIPEMLKKATVSVEDHRFYNHSGIDVFAIARATISNLREKELVEGGSSITQQLAQNLYLSKNKEFTRKIAEAFITIDLEKNYSKDEILEAYLNIIYYGDGFYGVGNASKGYFNKIPSELTVYEQTLLAGLPNAPSVYALSNESIYTYQRQNQVIEAMLEVDNITEEQAQEIYKENEEKIK